VSRPRKSSELASSLVFALFEEADEIVYFIGSFVLGQGAWFGDFFDCPLDHSVRAILPFLSLFISDIVRSLNFLRRHGAPNLLNTPGI